MNPENGFSPERPGFNHLPPKGREKIYAKLIDGLTVSSYWGLGTGVAGGIFTGMISPFNSPMTDEFQFWSAVIAGPSATYLLTYRAIKRDFKLFSETNHR